MATRGAQAVSAIDVNRELYIRNAELAIRNKTLSVLHKISEQVTLRSLGVDDVVQTIVDILDKEFSYPFVAIGLCDQRTEDVKWRAFASIERGESGLKLREFSPIKKSSKTNPCVRRAGNKRKALVSIGELFTLPDERVQAFTQATKLQSTLLLVLLSDQEPIGAMVIGLNRSNKDLTRHERELFQALTSLVTISVEKAQIHERLQRTTEQLRVANRHLRHLDQLKTEFLSMASHQLRTPLAVEKGYTGMLRSGMLGSLQPKQIETLDKMHANTEQLIMLVNHLLDLSRIESDRLQVRLEPVDIRPVIDDLVKFISGKADEKGISLRFTMPKNPMMVSVDAEKVKEVFINLLDNAIKYSEKGSVVTKVWSDDRDVHVSVTDSGYGLTREDKDKLFQKFSMGSASKFVKVTAGVGLYVCKRLTDAMNGTITADSEGQGKGSTFTVTFPRVKS